MMAKTAMNISNPSSIAVHSALAGATPPDVDFSPLFPSGLFA